MVNRNDTPVLTGTEIHCSTDQIGTAIDTMLTPLIQNQLLLNTKTWQCH